MSPANPLTNPSAGPAGPGDGRTFGARQRLLALLIAVALVAAIAVAGVLNVRGQGLNHTGPETTTTPPAATAAPASGPTSATAPTTAPGPDSPAAPPSSSSPAASATAGDGAGWARSEAARQLWLPAALGFAEQYTLASKPASATAWAASLAPYSTAKVNQYLATRRLDQIPTDAAYDGTVEVLQYGTAQNPDQVAVQITYDDGYQLVLYISLTQQPAVGRVTAFDEIES